MVTEYPVLSLAERDRRWERVREMMRQKKVDCLLLAGLKSREQLEGYLTNDYAEGVVIFPLEGDPVCLSWTGTRITRHMENTLRGVTPWLEDMRVGITGPAISAVLKEKGFDQAAIGVVGLESRAPGEGGGYIPYKTWAYVLEDLKKATFVELSMTFWELVLVKSEEELELVRYAASIGEKACDTMLRT
ncbi:MAG: aminopeptidase P family N-terminal domain-containing protein [Deltaproteobacteria bacterium]|nr:aminopeptidase P family N-terminal domain-containing protein [Deltaproteobacteria bacterium]